MGLFCNHTRACVRFIRGSANLVINFFCSKLFKQHSRNLQFISNSNWWLRSNTKPEHHQLYAKINNCSGSVRIFSSWVPKFCSSTEIQKQTIFLFFPWQKVGKFISLFQKWWVPEPIAQKLMGSQEPTEPMLTEPLVKLLLLKTNSPVLC